MASWGVPGTPSPLPRQANWEGVHTHKHPQNHTGSPSAVTVTQIHTYRQYHHPTQPQATPRLRPHNYAQSAHTPHVPQVTDYDPIRNPGLVTTPLQILVGFSRPSKGLAERSHREESRETLPKPLETSPSLLPHPVFCRPIPTPPRGFSRANGGKAGERPLGTGSPRPSTEQGLTHTPRVRLHSPTRPTSRTTSAPHLLRLHSLNPGVGRGRPPHIGRPQTHRSQPEAAQRDPAAPSTTHRDSSGLGDGAGLGAAPGGSTAFPRPGQLLGWPPSFYITSPQSTPPPITAPPRGTPPPSLSPPRHPFPCSPETHPRLSRLPEAPNGQLGVGRPAHLVRSPGGSHEGAGPAEGGSGGAGFWPLGFSGSWGSHCCGGRGCGLRR